MKRIHYISGIVLTLFVGFHLLNQLTSIAGVEQYMAVMDRLRIVYRNAVAETVLLLAVVMQIISGIILFMSSRKQSVTLFQKLHIWSGLYLAIFLIIHVSAILGGRYILQLDTNFYYGAAGLNTYPLYFFFYPYYGLAIISFFGHIASVHYLKMKKSLMGMSPQRQAIILLATGILVTAFTFYGLTNGFNGVDIPAEYNFLIGQ